LQLTPSFNIFFGENGAGKTSLLEAIYYLGMGRSFRTHLTSRVIEHDQPSLMLTATIYKEESNQSFIGLERMRGGERTIKLDREIQASIAPIARLIPLQLISVDSYRYFSDGPKERRSFLDWGVFHMNTEFLALWQSYNRVLKQRNAALKSGFSQSDVSIWNNEYIQLSEDIDALRTIYIEAFKTIYNEILLQLLPCFNNIEIRYKRGWTKDRALQSLLNEHFLRDSAFGYTQDGPHRADLQLYIDKCPADDILSQGQLKLAAYALHLAQGILLKQQTGKAPIYLIDDLPSELDIQKQTLILDIIKNLNAQVFITGITADTLQSLLDHPGSSMFHVEHGVVEPCMEVGV
jgi:DNA replication and repair protein RecF